MLRHPHFRPAAALLLGCAMLVGCATAPQPEATDFVPVDLRPQLAAGRLVPNVDRYLIVLDASGTMGDHYRGRPKLDWAKMAAMHLYQGRTGIPVPGAIRTVGDAISPVEERTALVLGFSGSGEPGAFRDALAEIDAPVGRGVLGRAIRAAGADLAGRDGQTALILITDGLAADDPVAAAADLAAAMGDALCIHGVWIGPEGQGLSTLESVVRASGCGRVAMVEALETPEAVVGQVKEIFLTPGVPTAAAARSVDADGDGIPDLRDHCTGTPAGVRVDSTGCWIIEAILFGTGRSVVRPEYYTTLEEVAAALRENPRLHVALAGHTDHRGAAADNLALSYRRAQAVAAYLAEAGIDRGRLLPTGFGMAQPVAENASPAGRARNRRVEIRPLRVQN